MVLSLLAFVPVNAAVKLASPFADHMVLQQGMTVPVWGWAGVGEKVTVNFAGQEKSATAGADGRWRVELRKLAVSAAPRSFTVTGSATTAPLVLNDVLVGEVWICGGQSNMERQLGLRSGQKPIDHWEQEVAAANHPLIRQLYVTQTRTAGPQESVTAEWSVCSPATVADFTAVGYFFARDLQQALGVPVGIIHASWGGTPAEAWMSAAGLAAFPEYAATLTQLREATADPEAARRKLIDGRARWFRDNDPGSGSQPWSVRQLDTSGWERMNLPVAWENAGHAGFDGVVWLRKTFDLPAGWAGHDLELRLGAVDDMDTTWVNGTEVGSTSGWTTPRVYRVPAGVLQAKGNVVAVRVLDTSGNGGIWNPALPIEIAPVDGSTSSLSLNGYWAARFALTLNATNLPPTDATQSATVPTVLYNGMIAPLVPYAIRGVTFYQGENNASRATEYHTLFPALIADWRKQWGEGDYPFLFVQIAPFRGQPPEIREAQLLSWQATKKTAMIVTIDAGDADDIHPSHKQPVGARLALAARAVAYGERIEYSGPVYRRLAVKSNRAVLQFTHLGGGLVAHDGPLTGFTIAGEDGVFQPAQATIEGGTVVVSSPHVATPQAVRYGWANVATGNLFNAAGLPASPFRTDTQP